MHRLPTGKHPVRDALPERNGAVAQLGERSHGMRKVRGSIPLGSTIPLEKPLMPAM
jgi:hypothetical protein